MSGHDDLLSRRTKRWVEALTWHETLTELDVSQLTSTVVREWERWYADPENRHVFEHLAQLESDGRSHPQAHPCPGVEGHHGPSLAKRRPWLATAVAVAAVAAMATLSSHLPWSSIGMRRGGGLMAFQTGIGALKHADLPDGSRVTLGDSTELVVKFSAAARSVELLRGEAWFRVAHNPKWPFVVHTGDGAVRAVGTAFLVTRDSDRVVVRVTEGTVAVTTPSVANLSSPLSRGAASIPLPRPIRVTRGQQVSYLDTGTVAPVARTGSDAATAWMQGRLIFNDEPLDHVIEGVNQYSPLHISATRSAGKLRLSGVILNDDIEEWLDRLPAIIPVHVDKRGEVICIRLRDAQADAPCATSAP
jgi:transmembrane sensor